MPVTSSTCFIKNCNYDWNDKKIFEWSQICHKCHCNETTVLTKTGDGFERSDIYHKWGYSETTVQSNKVSQWLCMENGSETVPATNNTCSIKSSDDNWNDKRYLSGAIYATSVSVKNTIQPKTGDGFADYKIPVSPLQNTYTIIRSNIPQGFCPPKQS